MARTVNKETQEQNQYCGQKEMTNQRKRTEDIWRQRIALLDTLVVSFLL
jgi:hypothetical protein